MSDSDKTNIIDDDYEFTRQKLRDVIDKGSDAFETMLEVARESEHPRAYEVLSTMMKTIGDMSEKLIDVNKKQKDLKAAPAKPKELEGGTTTNNVFFVGSTNDLQKMIKQQREAEVIDIDEE